MFVDYTGCLRPYREQAKSKNCLDAAWFSDLGLRLIDMGAALVPIS